MRLKQIKLVGFKSFVDATTVPFPNQMTAIVGPNGCGKSNIIDAVRWVLGESSAKNLRGDAMTDVIFNGSSARKPVFQASVELVFENTQGRIAGSMADRSEISVKRLVTRDATNSYFLNGTKCRRRDITDIFLGTGLGPRSYAIIEQGTISRLIESKPQELRVFIEEAAGISKYKERRRETETRIRATRDNLDRLADVRAELGQQIEKLHKQAEAATRFKSLKQAERKFKAELSVLKWQKYNEKSQYYQQQVKDAQQTLEQMLVEQQNRDTTIFAARQQVEMANDQINDLQQEKVKLAAEISRLEQTIKHARQLQQSLRHDIQKLQSTRSQGQERLLFEREKLTEFTAIEEELAPQLDDINDKLELAHSQLDQLTSQYKTVEAEWEQSQSTFNNHQQRLNLLQHKLTTLTSTTQRRASEIQCLKIEATEDKRGADYHDELTLLAQQQVETSEQLNALAQQLSSAQTIKSALGEQQATTQSRCNENERSVNKLQAEIALLTDLQAEQGDWLSAQRQWLNEHCLGRDSDLLSTLAIESGWELAVETVLQPILLADITDGWPAVNALALAPSVLRLVMKSPQNTTQPASVNTLAEKVSLPLGLKLNLQHILVAESFEQALTLRPTLQAGQSIVTRSGEWIGADWLISGQTTAQSGLVARQQQLTEKQQQLEELTETWQQSQAQLAGLSAQLTLATEQVDALKDQISQLKSQHDKLDNQHTIVQLKSEQYQQQWQNQQNQLQQLQEQQTADLEEVDLLQIELLELASIEQREDHSAVLNDKRKGLQMQVERVSQQIRQLNQQRHTVLIDLEAAKSKRSQGQALIEQAESQLDSLQEQQQEYELKLEELLLPLDEDEATLAIRVDRLAELDQQITTIRSANQAAQDKVKQFELSQSEFQQQLQQQRDMISERHVDAESYRVRARSALEQLNESGMQLKVVMAAMPDNAKEDIWQYEIEKAGKAIARLGAINLAAIDEYQSQLERKTYLDKQNDDLVDALTTLENVIAKIDRESRSKFKTTFEQVNADLQALFPKVFGGGQAYLDLTDTDLLETGVTIMARPPGKKNSTIHLLSGGEKALTALSLVFAIFRLNPSPFCMLDEVDAPLDDANVGRFCNLVKEMSQTVQFVYISHNKIAMEMATQLTGVTMHEPGVSRMVAVDIDEAIAMAEVS